MYSAVTGRSIGYSYSVRSPLMNDYVTFAQAGPKTPVYYVDKLRVIPLHRGNSSRI
jgi:hypothetical protein